MGCLLSQVVRSCSKRWQISLKLGRQHANTEAIVSLISPDLVFQFLTDAKKFGVFADKMPTPANLFSLIFVILSFYLHC